MIPLKTFILVICISLLACTANEKEEMVDSDESSAEVYKEMLQELKEPEGMLEKEKFYAKKAFLEEQSGLLDDAIKSLQNAISLNPNLAIYHFRLAKLYLQKGEIEDAHLSAKKAIDLGSASEDLLLFTAGLYLEDKDYKEGLYFIEERFPTIPESPELQYIKGKLKLGVGDSIEGRKDLQKAADGGNKKAINYLAELYLESDPQKVINLLSGIENPEQKILWMKARAFKQMGFLDSSLFCMEDIKEPTAEQSLFYARTLAKKGQTTSALEQYDIILQNDSTNETARNELSDLKRNVAYLQSLSIKKQDTVVNSDSVITKPDSLNLNE